MPLSAWMPLVERASALTHAHDRSKVGCGIYACILTALLDKPEKSAIYTVLARAEEYYRTHAEIDPFASLAFFVMVMIMVVSVFFLILFPLIIIDLFCDFPHGFRFVESFEILKGRRAFS